MMTCGFLCGVFFFKQKTAYEMRISDWSSDVCSSDLQTVPFVGKAQIKGVEFDGHFQPVSWFALTGALTLADPKYKNFENAEGADPSLAEGNRIVREPKIYGNIRPSFNFTSGGTDFSVYGRYTYTGKRYVDIRSEEHTLNSSH